MLASKVYIFFFIVVWQFLYISMHKLLNSVECKKFFSREEWKKVMGKRGAYEVIILHNELEHAVIMVILSFLLIHVDA